MIFSLQLHRFKAINDRHGYDVGDRVLRIIASSLEQLAGADDLVARLAGDEFAIALSMERDSTPEAEQLGERVLRAVTRPMEAEGRLVQVGAFLGIAASDPNEGQIPDYLRRADIALDRAKSSCSARPVWFDEGMERALIVHSEIEQGIRYGFEHAHFIPYFEPQVDLLTGEIIGFEVLARWDHPLSGLIEPDRFIPVAEEHGLIGRLSEQVILAALTQAANWDPAIKLSVNISPSQLADSWLAQRIVRLLAEAGFPADRLVVEITESSLFADLDLARTIVTSLKNQGIRLALDDFGTGFSSLAHLRSLPFDVIKIDRSFVSKLVEDPESAAIVRAVTTLAEAIRVPVTVEGIEDAATHAAVAGFGCAVGQGWYFGKPMSGEQATALLRSRRQRAGTGRFCSPKRLSLQPLQDRAVPSWDEWTRVPIGPVDALVKKALSISHADSRNSRPQRSILSLRQERQPCRRGLRGPFDNCQRYEAVRADLCRRLPVHDDLPRLN